MSKETMPSEVDAAEVRPIRTVSDETRRAAGGLAYYLGYRWRVTLRGDSPCAFLHGPDDVVLSVIHLDAQIEVRSYYTENQRKARPKGFKARFPGTLEANWIAPRIKRRLVPGLVAELERITGELIRREEAEKARERAAWLLAYVVPGAIAEPDRARHHRANPDGCGIDGVWHITEDGAAFTKIALWDVPADLANQLALTIRNWSIKTHGKRSWTVD